jgi:hypothetical protein
MSDDVTFEDFKGNRLICIPAGEYKGETQYLKMGYKKAKAALEYMDDIEKFCIDQEMKGR